MTDYCTLTDVYPLMSAVGELRDAVEAVEAVEADPDAEPPVEGVDAVAAEAATQLTKTAAELLITQVSAEINGHLRARGYILPVADTEGLATLKAVCQSGTAARILRSLFPASEGVSGDAGAASAHEKTYQAGLALIDKGGLAADMARSGTSIAYDFSRHRHGAPF